MPPEGVGPCPVIRDMDLRLDDRGPYSREATAKRCVQRGNSLGPDCPPLRLGCTDLALDAY